jgi:glutathione S-transferase
MAEKPTLYVCDADEGGPKLHPCRRVQGALKQAGIEYDKVVVGPGGPVRRFTSKGKRPRLMEATGAEKLPALKLPDGTVIAHAPAILRWVKTASPA